MSVEFFPVMLDEQGNEHAWQGDWFGVEVLDLEFGYSLSLPLSRDPWLPQGRDVELLPVHPFGEVMETMTVNTTDLGPDVQVDLGAAPSPLPLRIETTVYSADDLATLDFTALYGVEPFTLECRIPVVDDSLGGALDCDAEGEWVACSSLAQPDVMPNSISVNVRYAELPSLGCGELIIRVADVVNPDASVSVLGNADNQFINLGAEGTWLDAQFVVASDNYRMVPAGDPSIGILAADGQQVDVMESAPCEWISTEPSSTLEIVCAGNDAVFDYPLNFVVLEAKYTVFDSLHDADAVLDSTQDYSVRGRFRVLGQNSAVNQPLITRVVPAYGDQSNRAQFAQLWVQVAARVDNSAPGEAQLTLSADVSAELEDGAEAISVANSQAPAEFSMVLSDDLGTNLLTKWVTVDMVKQEFDAADTERTKNLRLVLSTVDASDNGNAEVTDEVMGPWKFADRAPQFITPSSSEALRFPADHARYGAAKAVDFPVTGLGVNRGGYVFQHTMDINADNSDYWDTSAAYTDQAFVSMRGDPGNYEISVGSKSKYDTYFESDPASITLDSVNVELVRSTEPAVLAFNKLYVGDAPGATVDVDTIGDLERLLWDPITENLIVVGEDGLEFFRESGSGNTWASIGTIEIGDACGEDGEIVDAVIGNYQDNSNPVFGSDPTAAWRSKVSMLVTFSQGQSSRHCWLPLNGMTSAQAVATQQTSNIGAVVFEGLSNGDCEGSLRSTNGVALGFDALTQTYWALSNICMIGYKTDIGDGTYDVFEQADWFTSANTSASRLTIEPHSGVAIAEYGSVSTSDQSFQRLTLGEARGTNPTNGAINNRDAMVYDPVRGWNWEVTSLDSDSGLQFFWMPSAGSLNDYQYIYSEDSSGEFYNNYSTGMNHAVMDASRGYIHSLKHISGQMDNQHELTREVNAIHEGGGNITLLSPGEILFSGEFVEPGSGDDDFGSPSGGASNPVVDIIMIGPQVVGGLPDKMHPGELVTVLGQGFTGDVLRDRVCVQGICVTPDRATPTALAFRVPQDFSQLDIPLNAYVTVDDGHMMSGPVPGKSKLVPHVPLWSVPKWSRHHVFEDSNYSAGSIYPSPDGVYLAMESSSGASRDYRLDDNQNVESVESNHALSAGGFSAVVQPGGNTTFTLGQRPHPAASDGFDPISVVAEVRVSSQISVADTLPALSHYGDYIQESIAASQGGLSFNMMDLPNGSDYQGVFLSPDQSHVGVLKGDSGQANAGVSVSQRFIPDFTEPDFTSDDVSMVTPLPTTGGSVVSSESGLLQLAVKDSLGNDVAAFDLSAECGWSEAQSFKVFARTGETTVVGAAVFADASGEYRVRLMTLQNQNGQWSAQCAQQDLFTNALGHSLVFASNDDFFAAWVQLADDNYQIYAWAYGKEGIDEVFSDSITRPLDIQFSEGGDELYLLRENKFSVLKFAKKPQ